MTFNFCHFFNKGNNFIKMDEHYSEKKRNVNIFGSSQIQLLFAILYVENVCFLKFMETFETDIHMKSQISSLK